MATFAFVSDLHLFASRSTAYSHFDELIAASKRSDRCILGGDIFDFRWSRYRSPDATADAAIEWLQTFINSTGNCEIHFLLGNHDDHPLMHERLPTLASNFPRFQWSRFYHRLGDTLFLHGDVADRKMTAEGLEQQRDSFHHGSRSPIQHRLYDMAVKANLHLLPPTAAYPRKTVAKRILSYMDQIGHGPDSGIKHVCFGHTHRPIDNYQLGDITFHNCGAPIGKGNFRIVHREVDTSDIPELSPLSR
ncbi:metallophosphoesterase [Planctomicrobium sp. SH668]|uniref:metallophosphoesterase n=1 Tax=Planctomicrobium sp. SH668 TaxID=3448126 RepID=UPI003F5B2CC0